MGEQLIPLLGLAFLGWGVWLRAREIREAGTAAPRPILPVSLGRRTEPPTTVWVPRRPAPAQVPHIIVQVPGCLPPAAGLAVAVAPAAARPLPAPPPAGPEMTPPRGAWQCLADRTIEGVVTTSYMAGALKTDQVLLMLEGGGLYELYSTAGGGLEGAGALAEEDLFGVLSSSELGPEARVYWRQEGPQTPGG